MLGTKLKALRQSRQLSQREVAESLSLSRSAYSNYENDLRRPDIEALLCLSELFQVPLSYFANNSLE
ncbi:helix-turn-helix domain-containing protein [Enterococcus canis]|uniref:helix-turn-helix domain-containing protein n=1 Tax=Enterococcus canis TaxID=214095 RepID=UPI0008FFFDFB|nr:helix-turn-helix transcriptional regulator [Enterococcus canis]